jgi:hypothetical protein
VSIKPLKVTAAEAISQPSGCRRRAVARVETCESTLRKTRCPCVPLKVRSAFWPTVRPLIAWPWPFAWIVPVEGGAS